MTLALVRIADADTAVPEISSGSTTFALPTDDYNKMYYDLIILGSQNTPWSSSRVHGRDDSTMYCRLMRARI